MSVSSIDPATPSSRRTGGRRGRSRAESRASSVEIGITNGASRAGDDDLPDLDDEPDLVGDDEENLVLEDDKEDGEELFCDNMEA